MLNYILYVVDDSDSFIHSFISIQP